MNNCSPFFTGLSISAAMSDSLHEIPMVFGAHEWLNRLINGNMFEANDTFEITGKENHCREVALSVLSNLHPLTSRSIMSVA
jgi:hypothetical protein